MSRVSKIKSSFRPRAFVVNQKNVKHEENHAPVSLALSKQIDFSSTKPHRVVDRPARWDLNNSKSKLINAHDSGPGRNLFNYHDRGARNVAVMPDVGVSGVNNDKYNPSMRLEPRPQRQESNASIAHTQIGTLI